MEGSFKYRSNAPVNGSQSSSRRVSSGIRYSGTLKTSQARIFHWTDNLRASRSSWKQSPRINNPGVSGNNGYFERFASRTTVAHVMLRKTRKTHKEIEDMTKKKLPKGKDSRNRHHVRFFLAKEIRCTVTGWGSVGGALLFRKRARAGNRVGIIARG